MPDGTPQEKLNLVTGAVVMRELEVSRWWLFRMRAEKRLPGVYVLGPRTIRYDLDEVRAFVRKEFRQDAHEAKRGTVQVLAPRPQRQSA